MVSLLDRLRVTLRQLDKDERAVPAHAPRRREVARVDALVEQAQAGGVVPQHFAAPPILGDEDKCVAFGDLVAHHPDDGRKRAKSTPHVAGLAVEEDAAASETQTHDENIFGACDDTGTACWRAGAPTSAINDSDAPAFDGYHSAGGAAIEKRNDRRQAEQRQKGCARGNETNGSTGPHGAMRV